MQLCNVAAHAERGIEFAKVVKEKQRTGEEGRRSGA